MTFSLINYYQKSVFSCLQNEQIEIGRENGLSEKEISEYAKPYYNFMQMQQIRLAIEHDTDPEQRKGMRHFRYSAEKMKDLRLRLEHGELLMNPAVPAIVWAGLFAMTAAFAGLLLICQNSVKGPYLNLVTDEVVLEEGDLFDPMMYVESCSEKKGTLYLPENIDTSEPGRFAAVYHFVSDGQDIMRTLMISVMKPVTE